MRRPLAVLALLTLLVGCEQNRLPALHDVYLFGLEDARLSYFYGLPGNLSVDGVELSLTSGEPRGTYAVADALIVDGAPYQRTSVEDIEAPIRVERIPLTTDLVVSTAEEVSLIVYYDGRAWFSLLQDAAAGLDVRVVPRRRIGRLRGIGELGIHEADALADALEVRGRPIALSLVPVERLPERSIDGLSEYMRTGLYLQPDVPVDVDAYRPPEQEVVWEVLAQGGQAVGVEAPNYLMVTDEAEFLSLWNRANGNQLTVPPLPDVTFGRETVLAIFLGQKPTGGYGAEVRRIVREDRELYVDLVERVPAENAITTQALTSPWVMIRVLRADVTVTWFRDPNTGQLFAAARAGN